MTLFNAEWYLRTNPDVAAAVAAGLLDAQTHFELHGVFEGRSPSPLFDPAHYLAANQDVAAAVRGGLTTAYEHFMSHGMAEGRSPASYFDPAYYLARNADIAAAIKEAGISAFEHFMLHGQNEARAISPFFDLGAYLKANTDVAVAVADYGFSPLDHLLNHGFAEGRPLGNGVTLGQFANDPAFKAAVAGNGNPFDALARVAEVAPFLPTFQPPAGWTPPANTPIPLNFVPVEGEKLVVPPSVTVPEGTTLPDTFEQDPAPQPEPVDPTPGEPAFTATIVEGTLKFGGTAKGNIEIRVDGSGDATFLRGGKTVVVEDFADRVSNIELSASQTLALLPEQAGTLAITTSGSGKVEVGFSDGPGTLMGNANSNIKNLALVLDDAYVTLPADKGTNLLVYPGTATDTPLKTLTIDASGHSSLDLGNLPTPAIGYFLEKIDVVGGEAGDSLSLNTLYFGKENTIFDSTGYRGGVALDAYIYNGATNPQPFTWQIKFGKGDDLLTLHSSGDGNYPGINGSIIDGGMGSNTLMLKKAVTGKSVYEQWSNPDTSRIPEDLESNPIVQNFQNLVVEVEEGMDYQSTLLGNKFESLALINDGASVEVSVQEGFGTVFTLGEMNVGASALKGSQATIFVGPNDGGTTTIRIAELDLESGNKSDLAGARKSDMNIVLASQDCLAGSTIIIENMTVASANDAGLITNDTINFGSWGLEPANAANSLAELITTFTASKGDGSNIDGSSYYVDFKIDFEFEADVTFTLDFQNIVNKSVFEALAPGHDFESGNLVIVNDDEGGTAILSLIGVLVDGGTFVLDGILV